MKNAEIHILSDEVINKIAAGEVIERPASIVKELIENAIDAEATRIQIAIEQGGKKKILVTDNGKGMGKADLDLCYLRHTTSKLLNAEDLFHLHTNGFRGEAVASIAAVSKLTITSATGQGESGRIIIQGGNVLDRQEIQANKGTCFLVEDLFYNTPVRKTFLSSETTEGSRILDVIIKTAIAHPEIRFDYKAGDKTIFTGVPGELRSRIAEAIGSKIAKALLKVDYTEAGIHVQGYISPPTETNGKRHHQFLYIRKRPIENRLITRAITQSYEPYGVQCKPATVLFLDMADNEFDVNVHPAKREVRFANGNLIFTVVLHAIREAFKADLKEKSPFIDLSEELPSLRDNNNTSRYISALDNFEQNSHVTNKINVENDFAQDLFSQPEAGKIISLEKDSKEFVSQEPLWNPPAFFQIAKTYIAGEDANGLLVIDQHAAHSRVLYEQALDTLQKGNALDSQELLFPELLELNKIEEAALHNVDAQFKRLGFFIEPFGGSTYQIRAIPSPLPLSRAIKAVKEFLDTVGSEENQLGDISKVEDIIAKAWAKTNAYEAGDTLKPEEMATLVSQLMLSEEPLKSPYGTPTLMRITLEELGKKFRH